MARRHVHLLAYFAFAIAVSNALAQESMDVVDRAIVSVFQMNNGRVLCLNSNSSLPVIRKSVDTFLQQRGVGNTANQNDVANAAYTLFPCPFSPYREELRAATAKDVEGVWLYPEASQKLKLGPKSPMWAKYAAMPVKCEGVGYYPDGEARNTQIGGQMACPFHAAKDMDGARANPKVASWQMVRDGLLKISRTDVQDHVEEWEVFAVVKAFEIAGIEFKAGDLTAYLRRERGNDFNAATMFRHLRRLP